MYNLPLCFPLHTLTFENDLIVVERSLMKNIRLETSYDLFLGDIHITPKFEFPQNESRPTKRSTLFLFYIL